MLAHSALQYVVDKRPIELNHIDETLTELKKIIKKK